MDISQQHFRDPEDKAFHDSVVDVQAQTNIGVDPRSVLWIDREISIRPIHKIFSDALMREWKKKMEPLRGMHEPWSEQTQDKQVEWEPDTAPKVATIPAPLQK